MNFGEWIDNWIDKAENSKFRKIITYIGVSVGIMLILFVVFGLYYIISRSTGIPEGIANIEKIFGLVGIPSGIRILVSINKKLSRILPKEPNNQGKKQ